MTWCTSKSDSAFWHGLTFCLLLIGLLLTTGCIADNPNETDIPWAAPASWEGTMPLPGGYTDRYY